MGLGDLFDRTCDGVPYRLSSLLCIRVIACTTSQTSCFPNFGQNLLALFLQLFQSALVMVVLGFSNFFVEVIKVLF